MNRAALLVGLCFPVSCASAPTPLSGPDARIRLIIETDAGGDPDDEQSLVRFLLYAGEWDVEGIIANRPIAREGENRNFERSGLGIVQAMVKAYGECHPNLVRHDRQFPSMDSLLERTVSGYEDSDDGVNLILAAVDGSDPRPVWFSNWGTDHGSSPSNLKRALDKVLKERGPEGYARFKSRIRLSSDDQFGDHTWKIAPPFPLWVDTLRPELEKKRWYHQFSRLTATAGGFDVERDVRTGHGPLGALYPTNTTHKQKEGDTMMFLYLVPTGMNDPERPTWGSWAGRYGIRENAAGRPYYWASEVDAWPTKAHRDNTLLRWAEDLQNDFRARMDWCVRRFAEANHPPSVRLEGPVHRTVKSGGFAEVNVECSDPDGHALRYSWMPYPEAGTHPGELPKFHTPDAPRTGITLPVGKAGDTVHAVLIVRDSGDPPLARYQRVVFTIKP